MCTYKKLLAPVLTRNRRISDIANIPLGFCVLTRDRVLPGEAAALDEETIFEWTRVGANQ